MKNPNPLPHVLLSLVLALACALPTLSRAVPYASGLSVAEGNVTFFLNEDADNVKVVFSGPASTLELGALARGAHTFPRGAAAAFEIHVTKSAPRVWTLISEDTHPQLQFFAPRSLAVNQRPASPYFGRIYVLEHAGADGVGTTVSGRSVTKGIFALNADLTDALGQGDIGLVGGLNALDAPGLFTAFNNRYDPWKIIVGEDDHVYVADAQDPRGALARVDADIANGELVLAGLGNTTRPDLHTVVYGISARGSLAAGNLTIWGIDGQWQNNTMCNSVLRWDVGAGPLPAEPVPVHLAQPGLPTAEVDTDLDAAPDGNIFVLMFRSIVDAGGLKVYSPSGTLLWTSLADGTDRFLNVRSLKVSPDNSTLAVIRADQRTVLVALTNGPNGRLPDLSNTNLLQTFTGTSSGNGRTVTWDLAGNLYVANPTAELLRIWSPGGTATAITGSEGTFSIVEPPTTVTVAGTVAEIYENDATPFAFTLTRSGNTADALTVNLIASGTAVGGVDYTPAIPGSVTFAAGAESTNITLTLIDNQVSDVTKNVGLLIGGGDDYTSGTPNSANVAILDDDIPELSLALAAAEDRLLEGYSHARVGFQLTRKGLLATNLLADLAYSGAAARGVRFNGPSAVAIASNALSATFELTPINDELYQGDQTAVVSVAGGSGYTVGTPASAAANVIDDDYPAGTVLFADDFEFSDTSTNWIVNTTTADSAADFAFDYTELFVPPAPGSTSTKALRFRLNETAGAPRNAISASPLDLELPEEFRLKFQLWINYNGPMFDGGSGSTLHLTAGVGTTPDHANLATSAASDGIWFGLSGDGGSTLALGDCNAYVATDLQADATGVYAAGTENNPRKTTHPFYALWGGITAPAAQLANFSGQTGTSQPGNMGVSWHTVVLTKADNQVTWAVDGITLATVPAKSTFLGPNAFIGYQDLFPGAAGVPAMSFALVDNLRIETFALPPILITITGIELVGGNVEITFTGPVDAEPAAFKLASAGTVSGTYDEDIGATVESLGAGSFKATTAISGGQRFYQIKY